MDVHIAHRHSSRRSSTGIRRSCEGAEVSTEVLVPGGKKELETDSRIVVDHRDGWLRRNNLAEHNRVPVGRAPEVRWHSRTETEHSRGRGAAN